MVRNLNHKELDKHDQQQQHVKGALSPFLVLF